MSLTLVYQITENEQGTSILNYLKKLEILEEVGKNIFLTCLNEMIRGLKVKKLNFDAL